MQTEWSFLPEVFRAICNRWHQPQIDLQQTSPICVTGTGPPGLGSQCSQPAMGRSGSISFPTSNHIGQSGGEIAGLPAQQNHSDCSGVAQHALVLGSGGRVQPNSTEPAQSAHSAIQTPHRNLSNLNLHAWLLEPHQSRSRASLRQWQYKLRLLREDQPDHSMRQSGASVITWTSEHHL